MPTYNIVPGSKRTRAMNAVAAGSTTQTTSIIDMQGFQSAELVLALNSLTTGQVKGTVQAQMGNAANGSDMANLGGAVLTISDTAPNKLEVMEVLKPTNLRYLQFVITRNAQAAGIDSAVVTQYHSRKPPESDDATTVDQSMVVIDPEYVNAVLTVSNNTYTGSTTQFVTTARTSS